MDDDGGLEWWAEQGAHQYEQEDESFFHIEDEQENDDEIR